MTPTRRWAWARLALYIAILVTIASTLWPEYDPAALEESDDGDLIVTLEIIFAIVIGAAVGGAIALLFEGGIRVVRRLVRRKRPALRTTAQP